MPLVRTLRAASRFGVVAVITGGVFSSVGLIRRRSSAKKENAQTLIDSLDSMSTKLTRMLLREDGRTRQRPEFVVDNPGNVEEALSLLNGREALLLDLLGPQLCERLVHLGMLIRATRDNAEHGDSATLELMSESAMELAFRLGRELSYELGDAAQEISIATLVPDCGLRSTSLVTRLRWHGFVHSIEPEDSFPNTIATYVIECRNLGNTYLEPQTN